MGAGGTGGIGYSNKWTPARGIGTTMATRQIHNSNGVIGGAPASLGAGGGGGGSAWRGRNNGTNGTWQNGMIAASPGLPGHHRRCRLIVTEITTMEVMIGDGGQGGAPSAGVHGSGGGGGGGSSAINFDKNVRIITNTSTAFDGFSAPQPNGVTGTGIIAVGGRGGDGLMGRSGGNWAAHGGAGGTWGNGNNGGHGPVWVSGNNYRVVSEGWNGRGGAGGIGYRPRVINDSISSSSGERRIHSEWGTGLVSPPAGAGGTSTTNSSNAAAPAGGNGGPGYFSLRYLNTNVN